jgi:Dual specificity phosphatase, catalytic domain
MWLPEIKEFIDRVESINGRVFVHCIAGASRSVTAVIMHLISQHKIPLRIAYDYIKSVRPQIAVNQGFRMQLAELEAKELGCTSVAGPKSGRDWDFYEWRVKSGKYKPRVEEPDEDCCAIS